MARRQGAYTCSFCGKGREQTRRIIAGPNGVFICAECVTLCNEILAAGEPSQEVCEETRGTARPRRMGWRRLLHTWLPGHWNLAVNLTKTYASSLLTAGATWE